MFEVFLFTRMILYLPSDILINALDLNTKVGEFYNAFNLKEKILMRNIMITNQQELF